MIENICPHGQALYSFEHNNQFLWQIKNIFRYLIFPLKIPTDSSKIVLVYILIAEQTDFVF